MKLNIYMVELWYEESKINNFNICYFSDTMGQVNNSSGSQLVSIAQNVSESVERIRDEIGQFKVD